MSIQKVSAVQDESSHWYIIPSDMVSDFYNDSEEEELIYNGVWDEKWSKYMTGGDVNSVQLWADI